MSTASRPGPVARVLGGAIRTYQGARAGRPSPCRFQPSCSAYALEAVEAHGAGRGTWFAVRRLARCRPFGGHGWDPVPQPDPPRPPESAPRPGPLPSHAERTA